MRLPLLLFCVTFSLAGQTIAPEQIDTLVEAAMKAWKVPGASVAIVQQDRIAHVKGYGIRELGKEDKVTADTVFAIASVSKAFTTTAMAMLVDEGKMNWDDPVSKYLPWFRLSDPLASSAVTLRDIVSHRTGLTRHDALWIGSPWTREELIRRTATLKLSKPFRSAYQYQNLMFTTAGEVVAASSGKSYEEFVRTRIFEPLGMKKACFNVEEAQKSPDFAAAHDRGDPEPKLGKWRNVDNIGGAGEINASARDMAQWLRLHLNDGMYDGKRLVSAKNLEETRMPHTPQRLDGITRAYNPETNLMTYGMGWNTYDYRGQYVVSHGGALSGFRAHLTLLPKYKVGFVILSNLGGTQMPEALRNTFIDSMLGLPARDWNAEFQQVAAKAEAEDKKRKQQ
ncbi:MAG TPA: serine hydrolase domain-containing protein, partial [Bryobacteraceae bacterium]|nr:serine hydrolase domain-containing protein [Bryobacteraceae bacterium]